MSETPSKTADDVGQPQQMVSPALRGAGPAMAELQQALQNLVSVGGDVCSHPQSKRARYSLRVAVDNGAMALAGCATDAQPDDRAPDILADLEAAAARKWSGDSKCQQAGLFARAAAEIRRLRTAAMREEDFRVAHGAVDAAGRQAMKKPLTRFKPGEWIDP